MPTSSLDVFAMDLDAPELIQALDDFTKQILSPATQLSTRLEAAITAADTTTVAAVDEPRQIERTRIEKQEQQQTEEEQLAEAFINKLQQQILPLSTSNNTENMLPLSEPDFQILSEIFDEYNKPEDKTSAKMDYNNSIPTDVTIKDTKSDFNSFLDSYPYNSWDSPESVVESDILFPDLGV